MSLGDTPGAPANGGPANGNQGLTSPSADGEESRLVQDVLSSEIGVSTMLTRLKQSIASAKEFAMFLKKRSILEEEHANGLKKLCKMSQDSIARSEHLGGSFAKAWGEMMFIHDRMADNGMQFAISLQQMQEDLLELAAIAEKSRKGWKQTGLTAEQKVADLENAMRKSKVKYDALAEEYDRVRTGDTSARSGKVFGFKGPKSAAQHEEDLHRKVQASDQDYRQRVETVQTERRELMSNTRPEVVKALQDIAKECDSGLTLQLQKFASFNEKLLLSNGLSISPLKSGPGESLSLRESIRAIDNDRDLNDFILGFRSKLPPRSGEPKYERNAVLEPQGRLQSPPSLSMSQPPSSFGPGAGGGGYGGVDSPAAASPVGGHSYGQSVGSTPILSGSQRSSAPTQPHERSFSQSSMQNTPAQSSPYSGSRNSYQQAQTSQSRNSRYHSASVGGASSGPPQLGTLPFQTTQSQPPQSGSGSYSPPQLTGPGTKPPQQQGPPQSSFGLSQGLPSQTSQGPSQQVTPGGRGPSPPSTQNQGPARPVFGITLQRLYERDGLAVPMVVYQCIQAVDLYGLSVEGIYRLSGSAPHITKLKHMFDTDSGSSNLDFRNPENFFHDVNSVTGLLKQFFRDLPDSLLTREHYDDFIAAAKNEDETIRRDSLHAIINSLPDPNYATLRALALHLHRVIDNAGLTRMSCQNLAIVFGQTLMGESPTPGQDITDAGWKVRVVDTILQNTYQIFDDD